MKAQRGIRNSNRWVLEPLVRGNVPGCGSFGVSSSESMLKINYALTSRTNVHGWLGGAFHGKRLNRGERVVTRGSHWVTAAMRGLVHRVVAG